MRARDDRPARPHITSRQNEALQLLCAGSTQLEVASALDIGVPAVKSLIEAMKRNTQTTAIEEICPLAERGELEVDVLSEGTLLGPLRRRRTREPDKPLWRRYPGSRDA